MGVISVIMPPPQPDSLLLSTLQRLCLSSHVQEKKAFLQTAPRWLAVFRTTEPEARTYLYAESKERSVKLNIIKSEKMHVTGQSSHTSCVWHPDRIRSSLSDTQLLVLSCVVMYCVSLLQLKLKTFFKWLPSALFFSGCSTEQTAVNTGHLETITSARPLGYMSVSLD